ncbi:hypothetical protein NLY43_13200 [Mesorhizobium sp. C416B]|uniref:hypothetical protein n=1 Tax=unclassified Mesorhizobium TaxID=325217 RepID=UPI0012EBA1CF|nr:MULTISPECIES: hypothetical protein [unclassified Mesorhizobium]WJI66398.1 hypothetical protein NLY43_13200 [Mesorhizobium sp. C416B]
MQEYPLNETLAHPTGAIIAIATETRLFHFTQMRVLPELFQTLSANSAHEVSRMALRRLPDIDEWTQPALSREGLSLADVTVWRRHLHLHPDLDFAVHLTARFVADKLQHVRLNPVHSLRP